MLQNGKLTEGRRLVAGFSAGITEALIIVTPFEVVKIRLQQQKGLARELLKYKVSSVCCGHMSRMLGMSELQVQYAVACRVHFTQSV